MSVSPPAKLRNFLGWAFIISIGLHLVLLPLSARTKPLPPPPPKPPPDVVSIDLSTPAPTPRPTPSARPRTTASALPAAAPHALHPVVHALLRPQPGKTAPGNALVPGPAASGAVANQGTGNGPDGPGGPGVALASTEPVATPTPTPKPACAQPHVEAQVTRAVEPGYPELAREQGITGTTEVKVSLSETGAVLDAQVYASSGTRALDEAAVAAAKRSTYAPEIDDCKREAGSYIFRAEFSAQ